MKKLASLVLVNGQQFFGPISLYHFVSLTMRCSVNLTSRLTAGSLVLEFVGNRWQSAGVLLCLS